MLIQGQYKPRDFVLRGLSGLSDKQIDVHMGLYRGYVTNVNALNGQLADLFKQGKTGTPEYAEMTRRLGFEYDGMILHEYYFGNLMGGSQAEPPSGGKLRKAIEASFGKYDTWLGDFRAIATMPGVGWAITYQDPTTGWLSNHWVTLHNDGNPAGYTPILVMDGWEHAFMRDYQATERAKYVDAFFKNVNWQACEGRLK